MIGRRLASLLSLIFLAAAVSGCSSSPPARFYTLDATATVGGAALTGAKVMVGPVSIPASVDQPQFVTKVASNRVEVDEFNRWASPLSDSIARAVAGDLAAILGTPEVATAQLANFQADYLVTIDVQRFESVKGEAATIEAVWAVRKTIGGETLSGRTSVREATQGKDFEALAAAHSRALAKLSGDIADAIRSENTPSKT